METLLKVKHTDFDGECGDTIIQIFISHLDEQSEDFAMAIYCKRMK